MKRILIALAVLLSVQAADAQVKNAGAALKAVDKAQEATQNEKKAAKPATWLKLAAAYVDAYNAPSGSAWIGAQKQELQLLMGGEKPISTESVVLGGEPCTKDVYADKEFYFNQNGQLVLINVTRPVVENALEGALEAYQKAWAVDVKQSKAKEIKEGLANISRKFLDEGMNSYMFEDYAAASQKFEKAAEASAAAPLSQVDTTALYKMRSEYSRQTIEEAGIVLHKLEHGTADWQRDRAEILMEQWLQTYGEEIELVLCNNDDMALGAADALEEAKQKAAVFGIDATDVGLAGVEEGKLWATIDCNSTEQDLIPKSLT